MIDRAQHGCGRRVATWIGRRRARHPLIYLLMRECDEVAVGVGGPHPIRVRRASVGLFDPLSNVAMQKVMRAGAGLRCDLVDPLRFEHHAAGDGRPEFERLAVEEIRLDLRPVTCVLIMNAEGVVPLQQKVNVCARGQEFGLDEAAGLDAQALVADEANHPVIGATLDRKGTRVLDGRRPWHGDHPVGQGCRNPRGAVRG